MLKMFKFLLFVSVVFSFSCLERKKGSTELPDDDETVTIIREEDRDDDKDFDEDRVSKRDRDDEIYQERARQKRNRLRQSLVLKANADSRYSSGGSSSFTGGRECEEYDDCIDICDRIMRTNRSRCYRFSYTVVEDMEDALFTIRNIDEVDRVDVDPYIFEAILTANKNLISNLVEDKMGEGDLKSFLAWIALNDEIARVLEKKDRSGGILEEAFKKLGSYQDGVGKKKSSYEFVGINTGLITEDDTFLYLSADEENEYAFIMAYDILNSNPCKEIGCQEQILCARENRSRSRSSYRYFGNTRGVSICRTSSEGNRRYHSRSGACYVHGSAVWSYLYELIDDDEIRNAPRELEKQPLGIKRCNEVCGRTSSRDQKCSLVNPEALR